MEDAHAGTFVYGDVHERPGDAGTTFPSSLAVRADHGNRSSIKAPNQLIFPSSR
ncbi:hypothetical protein HBH56_001650 [Parastagonospora nodorum]|uniref:Uncharacterized protein n=1 Tax=Phaeosphaeria nodorum (strain SN15 / ATCC MYA-4574 / FGSC 10173) TaxID=321614 RepID=A0A7U2ENK4_PHANO|nr:hypothetical protein HBH56_001650 [Parastagonospora nodorum]QRC90141.1 hypothetical protein JI435_400240 [Parastagonospora nodorum SN15]KAH3937648.1 hypothetical protein HBH54_001660 [Parastagonospora nodorum]KAH4052845.1 hypothetical protein HBH49_091460 [Parastagonospora nodorum]KAH4122109.1 hypothetical protein HBH47_087250 [Parastagonospora nodorum]